MVLRRLLRTPLFLIASTALLLAACGGGDGSSSKSPLTPDGGDPGNGGDAGGKPVVPTLDFSEFDAALSALLVEKGLAGASVVVVHADWGQVHLSGYGGFAPDRPYLIASSSKILSVGILMRLVDEGKLDVDAPISEYLGAWGSFKTDLTVSQLVANSSGLVSLTDNALYAPYICQYVDTGTLDACAKTIYTADDAADRRPPDTEFHYGGGPWQLAGGIAQVVSGKPWAELVKDAYVTGCGAATLGYTNQFLQSFSSGGTVGAALGYPAFFQGDVANAIPTENPSIEGGAYVTAEDYGKVLLMHLRGGLCDTTRVLSEASVARMQEDHIAKYGGTTGDPAFPGYGMGWWVDRDHPGVFADPGAYGAVPLIDLNRKYAAFLVLESGAGVGAQIRAALPPKLEAVFDAVPP